MSHPLDPLSADEFRATAAAVAAEHGVGQGWRYASIELLEPPKVDLLAWAEGANPSDLPRQALAVVWERATNRVYEAVVELGGSEGDRVVSWTPRPGVTPNFTSDEFHDVDEALHAHPDVLAAIAARGITDPSLVLFDVWTYGRSSMPEQWADRRLGWCDVWMRATPEGNPYAHPVSGLKIIVDVNTNEVLEIEDHHDYGFPEVHAEYDPRVTGTVERTDLKALEITQPQGTSFTLDGRVLRWGSWSMHLGFNYREGLVISQVTFDDTKNGSQEAVTRPIAHRLSFAEMIVPYRDPSFDHYRRTAYDIGEWGLGCMTTSLELGCDCLGEIVYLDAVLADAAGQPYDISQAICLHEEDDAVLWKHVDAITGAQVRRMRRMVVSFHATVANYEYLVYWRFYPDGTIECEVRATGLMVTTPIAEGAATPPTGTLVDERTYAPFHQHFLIAKLDLDIDGTDNRVVEVDSVAAPIDESNPDGLALVTRSTTVASESASARDYDWGAQRSWKVLNPSRTNAHGAHPAYKLVPSASIPHLMDPGAPLMTRAPVIGHTLWVTAQDDAERWPAGTYPTQGAGEEGVHTWITDDAPLDGADVVLWYVFGIHHVTRVEDWPVMPVDTVSFSLKPFGFFDANPTLDAPSTLGGDHCSHPVDHVGH